MPGLFDDAEIISSYSRAQAIADGVLVDVTEAAREAGFVHPVAMTAEAFGTCVSLPENPPPGQDEKGRLWDVLQMLLVAVRAARNGRDRVDFSVRVDGQTVKMYATCGPGDDARPVLTIMMPWED